MCKPRPLLAAALALLLTASVAFAQNATPALSPDHAVLQRRLDSLYQALDTLQPLLHRTTRAARAADSLTRMRKAAELREQLDTVRVGPFQVVTPKGESARARTEFSSAWSVLEPLAGARSAALEGITFLVSAQRTPRIYDYLPRQRGTRRVQLATLLSPQRVDAARFALARELDRGIPAVVRLWSGGPLLGDVPDWSRVYRALALSESASAQRCLKGELDACNDALSLRDPGPRWERWYTPAQLRAYVESRYGEASSVQGRHCVRGDDAACVQVLQGSGPPSPLPPNARRTLAQLALQRGGRAAYERLLREGDADMGARLEAAAGVPLPELVAQWRQEAIRARAPHNAGLGVSTLAVLVWSAVFFLLARRSTRWRIG